jgi:signal peptidase I
MEKHLEPEIDFEKRYRLIREVIEMAVLTVLMFLIVQLAVQNYFVEGTSMEPNLHDQERILVDKWTYLFHSPDRGDVIVFIAPPDPTQDYVKRIIAIPGDTLTIKNTIVKVDGVTLQEPYIDPKLQGNPYFNNVIYNMVIPPGKYFVLGDNRNGSSDSRDWGFVPRENIIGRAALVYWPFGEDNYGLLPNESFVFANVHQAGQPPSSYRNAGVFDAGGILLLATVSLVILLPRWRKPSPKSSADNCRH